MHAGPWGSVSRVQGLLSPLGPFLYHRGLRAWRGAVSAIRYSSPPSRVGERIF